MKRIIILSVFLSVLSLLMAGDRSIYVEYRKTVQGSPDEIARVYFDHLTGMYLFIDSPLIQHVKMDAEKFLYYYPEDNIALVMNNRESALASAALQLFMYTDREDLGLADMGFQMKDHRLESDTLIKVWELRGKKKREHILLEVYSHQQRVQRTVSYNGYGEQIKRVGYDTWIALENYHYPLHIRINEDGKAADYYFKGLRYIDAVPDTIRNRFVLPEDCDIYEYKW